MKNKMVVVTVSKMFKKYIPVLAGSPKEAEAFIRNLYFEDKIQDITNDENYEGVKFDAYEDDYYTTPEYTVPGKK